MGKGAQGSDAAAAAAGAGEVEENMAAWLVAKNTLKIMPFKLPPLGPHDVRVRMKAVGICGSDVHYLREMRIAHFVVKEPMVIGHECAGVIEEVGAGVTHLSVGDRVALEPGVSCWRCRHCKGGRYNLCSDMKFFATPPVHGSLANQVVHPGDLCFKLPDGVTLEEGAMCEPLSVGVHACRRAGVGPETGVLVVGAGPIGLVTLLAARAFGAPKVVIVDVDDHRLSVATSLGAHATVKVSTRDEDLDAEVERIQAAMGGADIDVSLDCAGFSKTMSTALEATRAGGKVCLIGMGHNEMTLPMTSAAVREVDLGGRVPVQGHLAAVHRLPAQRESGREAAHHPPLRLLAARRRGGLRGQRPRPRRHQGHVQPLGWRLGRLSRSSRLCLGAAVCPCPAAPPPRPQPWNKMTRKNIEWAVCRGLVWNNFNFVFFRFCCRAICLDRFAVFFGSSSVLAKIHSPRDWNWKSGTECMVR